MSSKTIQTLTLQKSEDLSATVLPDGRWLLYSQDAGTAITLTASAGILWELCDGLTMVSGLIEQLQEFYPDVPEARLKAETTAMLHDFLEQGLVHENSPDPT